MAPSIYTPDNSKSTSTWTLRHIYLDVYVPDSTRVEVEPDELHEVGTVSVSQLVYLGRIAGTTVHIVHSVRNLVALVVVDLSHDIAREVLLFGK